MSTAYQTGAALRVVQLGMPNFLSLAAFVVLLVVSLALAFVVEEFLVLVQLHDVIARRRVGQKALPGLPLVQGTVHLQRMAVCAAFGCLRLS